MVNMFDDAVESIRRKTSSIIPNNTKLIENDTNNIEDLSESKISQNEFIIEESVKTMENSIILKVDKSIFFKTLIISFVFGIIFGVMGASIVFANTKVKMKDQELSRHEEIYSIIEEQDSIIQKKESIVSSLEDTISDLNNNIFLLEEEKNKMEEELIVFRERKELYDKYEYILTVGPKKTRTDITYEQIKFGEQEMVKRGLNPHLLYSVISIESKGVEKAKNSKSTATGYCQFLKGTARWVYEDLLKKGKYTHDKALNGFINLEMGAEYLSYLMKSNNGDVYRSLLSYNGGELGTRYYQLVDSVLVKNTNTNLSKIQNTYRSNL